MAHGGATGMSFVKPPPRIHDACIHARLATGCKSGRPRRHVDDLLPETADRLERARTGEEVARRLRIAALDVGASGVLRALVTRAGEVRTFRRKRGGEGLIGRVTLDDGTGEVDLVLWDDETRLVRDGTFQPGCRVEIQGPTVRAGYRGGIELALGSATIVPLEADDTSLEVAGRVLEIEDTRIIDERFQAQVRVATDDGERILIVWDDDVRQVRSAGLGARLQATGHAHPLLEDHILCDEGKLLAHAAGPEPPEPLRGDPSAPA